MKNKTAAAKSSQSGSGKMSDFTKNGSWLINQIDKGFNKVGRGIDVIKDQNCNKKFDSLHDDEIDHSY
jgi:hypothetical protein